MIPYGIDYASVDGNKIPNVAASVEDGNTFVIQRACGDGFRPVEDPHFDRDRNEWSRAGVPFSGYLIMCWPTKMRKVAEPEAQAQAFVDVVGKRRPGELPPVLDVEFGAVKGRTGSTLSARQAVEWVERAHAVLRKTYGLVMIYTSARVWRDDLLGWKSEKLGECPLWIKTGYLQPYRTPPNLKSFIGYDPTDPAKTPTPWRSYGPGVWLNQIQGDAKGSVGFTSTTDINLFRPMKIGEKSKRVKWVQELVSALPDSDFGPATALAVRDLQEECGLTADGVVGPKTFVKVCAKKSARILAEK